MRASAKEYTYAPLTQKVSDDIRQRMQKITTVVLDVDGTLTDGGLYYTESGECMKRFHVRDGMGILLLHNAGIHVAIITSDASGITQARASKLRIQHLYTHVRNKAQALHDLSNKLQIPLEEIAFIGDDINDAAVMNLVGLSVCPADATPNIQALAHYRCSASGGNGAVREFVEMLLSIKGCSNNIPEFF